MQPCTSSMARAHGCACAMPNLPPRTITHRGSCENMLARRHPSSAAARSLPGPGARPQLVCFSVPGNYSELSSLLSRKTAAAQTSTAETVATSASAPTAATCSLAQRTLPFATISRILMVVQPARWANLAQRRPAISGPISLLLFLAGMVLAAWAAVRAALVRRVRGCSTCRGYGITRCNLCRGQGKVDWKAKFNYSDFCPLCMSKRYVECPDCGGHYHRPLFEHARRSDGTYAPQA